jgi:hypothetical protein
LGLELDSAGAGAVCRSNYPARLIEDARAADVTAHETCDVGHNGAWTHLRKKCFARDAVALSAEARLSQHGAGQAATAPEHSSGRAISRGGKFGTSPPMLRSRQAALPGPLYRSGKKRIRGLKRRPVLEHCFARDG